MLFFSSQLAFEILQINSFFSDYFLFLLALNKRKLLRFVLRGVCEVFPVKDDETDLVNVTVLVDSVFIFVILDDVVVLSGAPVDTGTVVYRGDNSMRM